MSWPRILVTGAGGFIGRRVAERLQAAGAERLKAGVTPRSAARAAPTPYPIVPCDMLQTDSLDAALADIDVVIHCARTADDAGSIEGTRNLLHRARAAGVRRFVHLSSVAVYGEARGLVAEQTPAVAPVTPYGLGKIASEADCRAIASADMAVCVLRPALVYGPGSELWTAPFIKRLSSGRWGRLGAAGEGRANLVHVDDLADFASFAARHDLGPFRVFNANGPEVPTWNEYIDRLADALGLPRPSGRLSTSLAAATVRRGLKVLSRRLPGRPFDAALAFQPSYQELRLFRLDVVYAMDEAARAGYAPPTTLARGLDNCAAWARGAGLI